MRTLSIERQLRVAKQHFARQHLHANINHTEHKHARCSVVDVLNCNPALMSTAVQLGT
jgi:hypothetical protein